MYLLPVFSPVSVKSVRTRLRGDVNVAHLVSGVVRGVGGFSEEGDLVDAEVLAWVVV